MPQSLNHPLFRALFENLPVPALMLTSDLTILDVNGEAEQLLSVAGSSLNGRSILDLGWRGLGADDFRGLPVRGVETRIEQSDGSERVVVWTINAPSASDPANGYREVVLMAGVDITGFQQAEAALREREARMSSIIATAPDGIITIDHKGIIQSFSRAAEAMFGYLAGEVVGRNIKILMPEPYAADHDSYIARYLHTNVPHIIGIGRKVDALHRDGHVFPVELAVGEVILGDTHIFTGFIRDLTARVRMEEELRHAQKMEAIGQLTGGVAHDFNNLLTVITGNLEMLEARLTEVLDREILGEAQEAAQLGADLSNRLLAFGRRQPLKPKPTDLSALVAGMSELIRRSLGAAITVTISVEAGVPTVEADPGQIENALLNLAINARDAMPYGGTLAIATSLTHLDRDYVTLYSDVTVGDYVTLSVTDTGTGMSEETRARAFEPFFTTKGPGHGTGLGLSMVYGLVKQTGGHIQLYSELGHGTTVRIYLPAAKQAEAVAETGASAFHAGGPAQNVTVLVVEDDARVRKLSVKRVESLGFASIAVADARSALDVLETGRTIDVLFTDMIMPGGTTGLELARMVRTRWPDVRILFTSGYADPSVMLTGSHMAGTDWLSKPYRTEDLARKLKGLLEG